MALLQIVSTVVISYVLGFFTAALMRSSTTANELLKAREDGYQQAMFEVNLKAKARAQKAAATRRKLV